MCIYIYINFIYTNEKIFDSTRLSENTREKMITKNSEL